jgi:hypothetical protein
VGLHRRGFGLKFSPGQLLTGRPFLSPAASAGYSLSGMNHSNDQPRARWKRWRVGSFILLSIVFAALIVLAVRKRSERTVTETILVLDADTLKPIPGIPVRFYVNDWRLRLLGGPHWSLGQILVERQVSNADGEAKFTWEARHEKQSFVFFLDVPSQYREGPSKSDFPKPDVTWVFFLVRKR